MTTPAAPPSTPPSAAAPAERMLLQGAMGTYVTATMRSPVRPAGDDHIGEVLPNLQVKRHRVQGADSWDRTVGP